MEVNRRVTFSQLVSKNSPAQAAKKFGNLLGINSPPSPPLSPIRFSSPETSIGRRKAEGALWNDSHSPCDVNDCPLLVVQHHFSSPSSLSTQLADQILTLSLIETLSPSPVSTPPAKFRAAKVVAHSIVVQCEMRLLCVSVRLWL